MSADDGDPGSGPDVLEVGPTPTRNRRVVLILVAAVVLALLAFTVSDRLRGGSTPPEPVPSPSSTPARDRTPSPTPTDEPTGRQATDAPQVVRRGSGPLAPGLPAGRLYVRTQDALFLVDPRSGRVVRTGDLRLGSSAPAVMVPIKGGVVLRSYDSVPTTTVPDARAPRRAAGLLGTADQVFPGPGGRVWVDGAGRPNGLILIDARGRPNGVTVDTGSGGFRADGRGGLLLEDAGGVWQAYPGPVRRITVGQVVATGAGDYLVQECDDRHRCARYRYDRADGERTRVG